MLIKKHFHKYAKYFFATAVKKDFATEKEKKEFRYKYLDYYFEKYVEYFFVAVEKDKVLGYVCGVPDSSSANELYQLVSYYSLFESFFEKFSAHLHMNTDPVAQGKGVGGKLIEKFKESVWPKASGLHIITAPDARNVSFYLKHNLTHQVTKELNGVTMLFMGMNFR
jgi:GNAT superfamily N-acetyltransferase